MAIRKRKSTTPTNDQDHLALYKFHGLVLRPSSHSQEAIGKCPFCKGIKKFFVNQEDGRFNCKSCGSSGNKYTFLQRIYDYHHSKTSRSNLNRLGKTRGISSLAFSRRGIVYRASDGCYLIPSRNAKGSMVNIGVYSGKKGDKIYRTPGCNLHLGNIDRLNEHGPIYLVEGDWDGMALEYLLHKNTKEAFTVLDTSASVFKEEWLEHFKNREVILIGDNDQPGINGVKKKIETLSKINVRSIKQLVWPESYADGYDLNDFIAENGEDPKECWETLSRFIEPVNKRSSKSNLNITRFSQVVKHFKKHMYLNKSMEDALAILCAVTLSAQEEGDPLWLFLVGPPGCLSGDTELVVNRAGKSFRTDLRNLYHKFHGGSSNGGYGDRRWDSKIRTSIQSRCEEDGTVRSALIEDVVYSGVKMVYELTLSDNRKIRATKNHRFLTECGWKPLGKLTVNSSVYANIGRSSGGEKKKLYYPYKQGLRYHPHANRKNPSKKCPNGMYAVATHRLVVEADMNSMGLNDYVDCLRYEESISKRFDFLSPELHVHHKDGNTKNFDLDNLEVCTLKEHFSEKHENHNKNVLEQTGLVRITSIRKVGREETFDICCADPHNFIANGIVVHNSGKTLLLQNFSDSPNTHYESSLGPRTLVSGWKTPDGEDASLLPHLYGKTLIVKDWTEIMSKPAGDQEEIYGVFRGAYDGRVERTYGNGIPRRVYPDPSSPHKTCHFALIAGVTHKIFGDNRASMGERFIKYRLDQGDNTDQVKRAIANTLGSKMPEYTGREVIASFLDKEVDVTKLPTIPKYMEDRIAYLASIAANIRVQVERKQGQMLYRPEAEVATRLAKQLIRLSRFVAVVFDEKTVSKKTYRIVQKVALDTCYSWHQDVFLGVANFPKGVTRLKLAGITSMSPSTTDRCLFDLLEVGAVIRRKDRNQTTPASKKLGAESFLWSLSPEMKEAYLKSKLYELNGKE